MCCSVLCTTGSPVPRRLVLHGTDRPHGAGRSARFTLRPRAADPRRRRPSPSSRGPCHRVRPPHVIRCLLSRWTHYWTRLWTRGATAATRDICPPPGCFHWPRRRRRIFGFRRDFSNTPPGVGSNGGCTCTPTASNVIVRSGCEAEQRSTRYPTHAASKTRPSGLLDFAREAPMGPETPREHSPCPSPVEIRVLGQGSLGGVRP